MNLTEPNADKLRAAGQKVADAMAESIGKAVADKVVAAVTDALATAVMANFLADRMLYYIFGPDILTVDEALRGGNVLKMFVNGN